jgi:hypothetical protein
MQLQLSVDVASVLKLLYRVVVGDVADVLEEHAASIWINCAGW